MHLLINNKYRLVFSYYTNCCLAGTTVTCEVGSCSLFIYTTLNRLEVLDSAIDMWCG